MNHEKVLYRHCISADIVGLTKPELSTEQQTEKIELLNKVVMECLAFKGAPKENMLNKLTGDGFIMGTSHDPTFPIKLAIELSQKLQSLNSSLEGERQVRIRIGIHSGPTVEINGITYDEWGDGLIGTTRVMSVGLADHILISSKTAQELIQLSEKYDEILHPIGDYVVKHDATYSLYSAYGEGFGNSISPPKTTVTAEPESTERQQTQKDELTSKPHIITIAVKTDRTVYPVDSKVYIRAKIEDILVGKPINVEVYNSNKKLLVLRKINPVTFDNKGLKSHGIYQTQFIMKGKEWKVGEAYTVVARHGNSQSEDSFLIDRRSPVIQSDKSVYLINSDVILTVIDPDRNRDSRKVETAGYKPNSLVTITSGSGKISGYKLVETGKDTGIFQGLLKFTSVKCVKNGRTSSHAGGKGPFDGHISVRRGELVHFDYSNGYQTAKLTTYGSNFGASIVLDQKIYTSTDMVYITVVAPDYNLDSHKVDVIGNAHDEKITISTSLGKISNYKLLETGVDTGIFTGMIRLKGPKIGSKVKRKSSKSIRKYLGSNNGSLHVANDDEIKVTFETFTDTFVATAKVQ